MKIYLNRAPQTGPWGGGNKTVTVLSEMLEEFGHEVVYSLQPEIDIIFCFDPRPNTSGEWYQHFINYKHAHGAKIIQRVGDLGTHGKPELTALVRHTIIYSDHLIFPSEWAKDHAGFARENFDIVHNAPMGIFHKYKNNNIIDSKIKLITHHWSTNPKKGFSYYKKLDDFIGNNSKFEFTYIGRKPDDLEFRNATYISATGDNDLLARLLSDSNIYITASEEEAGANHVLEAMASGLPVVYHKNGGSIDDYCKDYGEPFSTFEDMIGATGKIISNYEFYKTKLSMYNRKIEDTVREYMEIIGEV